MRAYAHARVRACVRVAEAVRAQARPRVLGLRDAAEPTGTRALLFCRMMVGYFLMAYTSLSERSDMAAEARWGVGCNAIS